MSNPLAAFRKYQKILLAVFGVALMIVFTVGSLVSQYLDTSQQGEVENDPVVSWAGGEIREDEMQMRIYQRNQLRAFQRQVLETTTQRRGQPQSIAVPDDASEASVIESMVLAREAEKLGIEVSDEAVLTHLTKHLSDNTVPRDELAKLLAESTGGSMSQQQLFDAMRIELLAQQLRIVANGTAFGGGILDTAVSPGESFDYFKRMRQVMEAQVMPVSVERFVAEVKESPTEAEIKDLYDEYKETYPSPVTPTPGFKRPKRAAFQSLKAEYEKFLDRAVASVTDEQIQEYYDTNKNSEFRKASVPSTKVDLPEETTEETPSTSDLDAPETTTDSTVDDVDTEESSDVDRIEGGEGSDDPAEVEVAGDEVVDGDEEIVEEQVEPAAEETVQDQPADSAGAEEQPAEETETDQIAEIVADYLPIEEVRDDIARSLARPLATEAIQEAITTVRTELNKYFQSHVYWEAAEGEDDQGPEPPRPNFQQLAETHGMLAEDIPLSNVLEIDQYELGRAFEFDFSTGQFQQTTFAQIAYAPSLSRFQPKTITADDIDSKFVFWKVEEKEEYTPELDEVKDEIIHYWKSKKALDLAKAKAESYAQEVRNSNGKSLEQVFTDRGDDFAVTTTNEFTWMTFGNTPTGQGAPRISPVTGTDYAGNEFMESVSKLKTGETGIAVNYPEKVAYVVYMMKGVSSDEDVLQRVFLNEGVKAPVLFMARQENVQTAADWYAAHEKKLNIDWKRPAGRGRQ